MEFTYIVHLISEVNDISAMTLLPAGRVFNPLCGDVGMAAAEKHVDCLVPLCQNGVVVILWKQCVLNKVPRLS